jgi:hypothetical protein
MSNRVGIAISRKNQAHLDKGHQKGEAKKNRLQREGWWFEGSAGAATAPALLRCATAETRRGRSESFVVTRSRSTWRRCPLLLTEASSTMTPRETRTRQRAFPESRRGCPGACRRLPSLVG